MVKTEKPKERERERVKSLFEIIITIISRMNLISLLLRKSATHIEHAMQTIFVYLFISLWCFYFVGGWRWMVDFFFVSFIQEYCVLYMYFGNTAIKAETCSFRRTAPIPSTNMNSIFIILFVCLFFFLLFYLTNKMRTLQMHSSSYYFMLNRIESRFG